MTRIDLFQKGMSEAKKGAWKSRDGGKEVVGVYTGRYMANSVNFQLHIHGFRFNIIVNRSKGSFSKKVHAQANKCPSPFSRATSCYGPMT